MNMGGLKDQKEGDSPELSPKHNLYTAKWEPEMTFKSYHRACECVGIAHRRLLLKDTGIPFKRTNNQCTNFLY